MSMVFTQSFNKRPITPVTAVATIMAAIIIRSPLSSGLDLLRINRPKTQKRPAILFASLDREKAGEFSFLLSIPAILAAFILEIKSADNLLAGVSPINLISGMISAFVVGYFSLRFLLKLIKNGKLMYFAFYLIPLGLGLSIYFWGFAG